MSPPTNNWGENILCCVFLRNVCHVLPVSHACPFWIAQSVFSNVYLMKIRRSSKFNLHFVCTDQPSIKQILIGTTSSGISYQLRDIYTPYAGVAGMLLHINRKFTMGKLKSVVCPFVHFPLAIVLSVLLRYTDSDYPFGIFKLFSKETM
jgi:hypothetical protein